jgi:peptide/nickel transport system substrate-binding protein
LDKPFAAILSSLAGIAIVPSGMEADKESLQQTPLGTGPFMFDSWKPNSHISLVKFNDYRVAGLPKLDGVNVNFIPESATRQVGIGGGDYHLLPEIESGNSVATQGMETDRFVKRPIENLRQYYISLN